jgi:serine/threonine protein kinase
MGAVAGQCPPPDELDRLLTEQLSGPERDALEAHIEDCSSCQERLDHLVGTSPALSAGARAIRAPAGPEPNAEFLNRLKQVPTQAQAPLPPPAEGLESNYLGQYEILGKLGQGGMGAVYKARHVELGKIVALKVLPADRMFEVSVARFKREIRAIGRLEHPNIVAAHDAGQHRGVHFLVMAFVDGIDLARLVADRGQLPVADACELTRQAALGLHHAFEHNLVHRDIKPSNLMLARDGVVKLLDLGLARSSGDAPADTLTTAGIFLGTADYVAPEQWDSAHATDTRADIYSLGCTLYHLLAGRPPFADGPYKTVLTKMQAHQQVPPPPISRYRSDVSAELAAVLDRMLSKDPADRFATPADVAAALRPFAAGANPASLLGDGRTVPASHAGAVTPGPSVHDSTLASPRRSPPVPARTRPRTLPIAAAVLVVAGLLWAAWFYWPPAGGPPGPAVVPLEIKELQATHRDKDKRLVGELAKSSIAVRVNDGVQLKAQLTTPAYYYLMAFNPHGTEDDLIQLCYPSDKTGQRGEPSALPDRRTNLQYPIGNFDFIVDAVGLQAFVLAASTKPLPPYAEWRKKAGKIPWMGPKVGGDWHGLFDGHGYTRYPLDRGRVEERGDVPLALRDLCDFFKGRGEFEAVQAIAFPVVAEQK